MRGQKVAHHRAQMRRAKLGVVVDLRRRGVPAYLDDSGRHIHLTAHGAFASIKAGLQAYSYSHYLGEPRFRIQRWLHVTAKALNDCLIRNRAATLDDVRGELCILIASVAPLGNIALGQKWRTVAIPTPSGLFTGHFTPEDGLRLDGYLKMGSGARLAEEWFVFHAGFPLCAEDAQIRSVAEALEYREDRLIPWLETRAADIGVFAPGSGSPERQSRVVWETFVAPFEEEEFVAGEWLNERVEDAVTDSQAESGAEPVGIRQESSEGGLPSSP
ncbi:hypothetical protein [Burkholderia sp. Ac-20365]|uniref:hypothetical protein n=1 Tax=Burkholderia sp. Ac-20365 TaxID=2703897 RepID=UPI00197B0795|nr:hypothetical protein [Burkholderia sp. Ac-20365]MBN3761289.1 hypothetical protein [Burkholderia sp. Ac-20365]